VTAKSLSLSAIVPAYNEGQGIESAILNTMQTFESLIPDFEIIIINDCSNDNTGRIAESLAQQYPKVHCWHHEKNLGSGEAFKTGISKATKDYVIFVPVDSPLDCEDVETYLPRMGICDIVVGFRIERVGYTPFARFASFFYNRILVPLLFNIGIQDVNWIQIYRRQLFTDGILGYKSTSLFWLVEVLIQAKAKHLIIVEVPARMKKRVYGKATSTRFSVILLTFIDMIIFFWTERARKGKERKERK
jgi:glycosyltransferase involved in cell wall biosynthesis